MRSWGVIFSETELYHFKVVTLYTRRQDEIEQLLLFSRMLLKVEATIKIQVLFSKEIAEYFVNKIFLVLLFEIVAS